MNLLSAFSELDHLNTLTEAVNPFIPGYESKRSEPARKTDDAEKQSLWSFWWDKYEGIDIGLRNAYNIFTRTVKNESLADMAQDYLNDLSDYYKKFEKLIISDKIGAESEEITKLIEYINKFFKQVHKFIQASERAIERNIEDTKKEQELIKRVRGEIALTATKKDDSEGESEDSEVDEEEEMLKKDYNVIYRLTYRTTVKATSPEEAEKTLLAAKQKAKILKVELAN
jgi:DNA replication initiation complex subunit (GINS family)